MAKFPAELSDNDDLWHLTGEYGINIEGAWSRYSGDGVRVGVVDSGFDLSDPDLKGNFLSRLSENFTNKQAGITGDEFSHGTQVTHLLVGDDDGAGGIGVAYDADWAAFHGDFSGTHVSGGLNKAVKVDVLNNSWNNLSAFGTSHEGSILQAVEKGRDGLGTAVVFSAGNHRGSDSTAATNGTSSPIGTITVAATDQNGNHAHFSSPGSSILVSAPGVAVPYDESDYGGNRTASGTSFSAPLVSGTIALMLEANPELGWRDIQEILAITSRKTDSSNESWTENGATNWNGGGMSFSNDYGFGIIDATAAVNLSESWTLQSTSENMETFEHEKFWNKGHVTSSFKIDVDADISLDQVQVYVTAKTKDWDKISIELVSPDGTVSVLKQDEDKDQSYLGWKFKSNAFWGESAEGEWTVQFRNIDTGHLESVKLFSANFYAYGSDGTKDDVYFLTSEFSEIVAADASRSVISDDDGGIDTINLAASSQDQIVHLYGEEPSYFNGTEFHFLGRNEFENATVGNGDDRVMGNDVGNVIRLGGGQDVASGHGGNDQIEGGAGNDRLLGNSGNDTIEGGDGSDRLAAGAGNDVAFGGSGRDKLLLGGGADRAFGGSGNDTVQGGEGSDLIKGGKHTDSLKGGGGRDRLYGEGGNDKLDGGAGDDVLVGGRGRDVLKGGGGDDALTGGEGGDRFVHTGAAADGTDYITDFSDAEGDVLVFADRSASIGDFTYEYSSQWGEENHVELNVIYVPTGETLWNITSTELTNFSVDLQIGGETYDFWS